MYLQIDAIRVKYAGIEKRYIKCRQSAKEKITGYTEDAASRMDAFLDELKRLKDNLSERHPVNSALSVG